MLRDPRLAVGSLALALAIPLTAAAAPTVINGAGSSTGINNGFGNAVGQTSNLAVSSDLAGNVDWILTPGTGNLDNANTVVMYIDTDAGATGYASTSAFTDHGTAGPNQPGFDELRAATSATNGAERADVTFAPGFQANYAIAFNSGFGVLFRLDAAGHEFIDVVSGTGFGSGGPYHFSHTLAELGLNPGGSFRYVLTYLDPVGTFRSNEFHGVADASVPDSNVGFDDVTLSAGDFNTFNSVPEPASLGVLAAASLLLARRRSGR